MAVALSTTIRNAFGDAITTAAGAAPLLRIYNGTRPATAGAATTLLAELVCNATFAPSTSGGVLTLNSIANDVSANATGTATWGRLVKSDGTTFVMDFDVGTVGSDCNLNTVSITSGGPVAITSAVLTMPNP